MRSSRRSAPGLLAGLLVVAGCAGADLRAAAPPPPPAEPAAEAPAAAPAIASAAPPSIPESVPSAATAAPPPPPSPFPPLEEPLPPLTRAFVTVTLPGVAASLIAVSGRGPRDVWFVTDEMPDNAMYAPTPGAIVRYDGKRVRSYGHPCFGYSFYSRLLVTKDEVLAEGFNSMLRGAPGVLWASLSPRGKWSCDTDAAPPEDVVLSGGRVWQRQCYDVECRIETPDGPSAPVPRSVAYLSDSGDSVPLEVTSLWMAGLNDGWLTGRNKDGRSWLLRYNGVTWAPQASLVDGLAVVAMWVDAGARVWLAARRGGKGDDPATAVLRFDGRALHSLPVPASFATRLLRGTGAEDVWFLGAGRDVYQWDGKQLRQGEAPFDVGDAWMSPDGDVWIVGRLEGGPGNGVVAHTSPAEVR